MTGLRARLFSNRGLTLALLAFALALRALLPLGTMPVADAAHGIRVLYCDGQGGASYRELGIPSGDRHVRHDPCPFGLLAAQALGCGISAFALSAAPTAGWSLASFEAAFALRTAQRILPPKRGPPEPA